MTLNCAALNLTNVPWKLNKHMKITNIAMETVLKVPTNDQSSSYQAACGLSMILSVFVTEIVKTVVVLTELIWRLTFKMLLVVVFIT